jgi:hypothetical protein
MADRNRQFAAVRLIVRNSIEFAVLFALWWVVLDLIERQALQPAALTAVVLAVSALKCAFFGIENIRQLWLASAINQPYYKFMLLMFVNMWQIMASFALDYHLLYRLSPDSFAVVNERLAGATLVFEFFYYSALNFMFFGYGDITPQNVPAKLLTLTEITLAFVTVIFLLSDFISLKESIRTPADKSQGARPATGG